MANVVNRTTKQYLQSVHTPDYPVEEWIINPDMSNVVGVPNIYWEITGDIITEMSQSEKDSVDAQILSDSRDGIIESQIDNLESVMRQLTVLTMNEINTIRQWLMSFKAEVAAATSFADLQSRIASLIDLPDRTLQQIRTQLRNNLGN
ncbi:MAG: hypothetical protein GWN00_19535 [Aliifodinibius sp.]|nr:hypothetical protein [Fodinibius sp.]NIY26917.1 hypothetical protein [Fodinibius sp.]